MTDSKVSDLVWSSIKTLQSRRWVVIGITGLTGIASVIISLLLPNWYLAETRLLIPGQTASGILSSIVSGQVGGATSLLGGLVSDYQQQLAILNSRTIKQNVVQEFGLIEVYDLADSDSPMQFAMEELAGNSEFTVDNEYNYLSIRISDKDPQRAADMANFFVAELNRIGMKLSTETARDYRLAVEKRYQEIEDSLDAVLQSVRTLQQQTGILDIPAQGAAFMEGLTQMRSEIFRAELEFDKLLSLYGPNNSRTVAAQKAIENAKKSYDQALQGREPTMPVAQDSLPEIAFKFAELQVQSVILTSLVEYARPLVEDARLSEDRDAKSVQVLDPAIPPTEKARPWRAAICVVTTLSGFMISVLYVLISTWWRRNHVLIASKLNSAGAV